MVLLYFHHLTSLMKILHNAEDPSLHCHQKFRCDFDDYQTLQYIYYNIYRFQKGIRTLKVLHLTDIHIDPNYHIGSMTECENELCCHLENGKGIPGKTSKYWGDYGKCDLPFHSYIDALKHISSTHPV